MLYGSAQLTMTAPPNAETVSERSAKGQRELAPDEVFLTVQVQDGRWTLATAAVDGRWLRKTDNKPGVRTGTVLFSGPLTKEDGAPEWLIARVERVLAAMDAAMDAVGAA
ncbi:hypothetical protein [Streptomyces andamanensis]